MAQDRRLLAAGRRCRRRGLLPPLVDAAPLAVLVTGLSVGVVESTQARNKLARNTTFILTVAALAVLVFFTGYLLQLNIGLQ